MQELDVNNVLLIGSLDKEPELRYTQNNNVAICQLRVKTMEYFVTRDGEQRESSSTHTVSVWGQKGEKIKNQLHINSRVYVKGTLRNRSYQDESGNTKWVTEINAQTVFPLDGGEPAVQQGVQDSYVQPQAPSQPPPAPQPAPSTDATPPPDDDLPF